MYFKDYIKTIADQENRYDYRVIRYRLRGESGLALHTALVIPTGIKDGVFGLDLVTDREVDHDDIYVIYSWSVSNMVRTLVNLCSYSEDFRGDI